MSANKAPKSAVRARAPLRLGLAGGGTDLSPYSSRYGGAVLNAAIRRYALATLSPSSDGTVNFRASDLDEAETLKPAAEYDPAQGLMMHRAIYNRVVREFNDGRPLPVSLHTLVECPMGAGLGASSALVVAALTGFQRFLELPLGEFEIAHLAFEIERLELGLEGGKQDQYAAAFGGVNFMEFASNDRVIVNPLRLDHGLVSELESNLLLVFSGSSRNSSDIIRQQIRNVSDGKQSQQHIQKMHELKRDALEMKAALMSGDFKEMAEILNQSWQTKKETAASVSNSKIDHLYEVAVDAGADAAKISGAGGGGFMMVMVDPAKQLAVGKALASAGCDVANCNISTEGALAWALRNQGSRRT